MKNFSFSILLMLMMASATLFAQRTDKDLVNKDNLTNNQQTLKDEAGHKYSCCSSHQFIPPETKSSDDKNLVVMWDNGSFITHSLASPNIEVNPLAFEEIHLDPPQITTQSLSISNTGTSPLSWQLGTVGGNQDFESSNNSSRSRELIWDNDPIITAEGVGSNGSDYSELQDASLGMGTYGFGCQISQGNTLADDFEITADWHNLAYITFYAYQTGSGPPSTITDVRFQIYDGDPSAGGQVIYGDLTTNKLLSTQWSNVWRVLESGPSENRPVMEIVADANCCYLTQGIYWVEFQFAGSGASGPWCPAVTIPGETNTGNAIQNDGTGNWQPIEDVEGQGVSFVIDAYLGGYENDVGISAILEPTSGVSYTSEEPVTIRLENFGTSEQSDIPYQVNWSGPTGSETVSGIYEGILMCGQYIDITLYETANLTAPGTYSFEACTQLVGDENPDNDCKTKTLTGPVPGNEWLSFDLFSGIINPGDSTLITLSFDSEIILPGQYFDTIIIQSDDPGQPLITIPVSLNVIYELIPPANLSAELLEMGEVLVSWTYYPTKYLQHFNIYRNDELIGISQDTIYTDSLPEFGIYNYEVTAFYDEGESESVGPVVVEWLAEPQIIIEPMELMETHLCIPQITTQTLTIYNTGTGALDWALFIENGDSPKIAGNSLNKNGKTKNRDDLPWEAMYSSGCSFGDGLIYWNLENVLVPEIPCVGNPPWYHDYKDRIHLLEPGNTYILTVQAGYSQTYFDVWINYNDDWQALDDELVLDDAYCPNANQDYSFVISIPETAAPGMHTMRYRTNWQNPVTHYWEEYAYGNCCDFTANISDNVSWLQADLVSGTIEPGQFQQVVFTFNSESLNPGIYAAIVNFTCNDPWNPQVFIPVTLLADGGEITYTWNPDSFEFEFFITEDPGIDYLEIENVGTNTLLVEFEIEYLNEGQNPKDEWLSVNPPVASIPPGNTQIFEVIVVFWELPNYHCEAYIILYTNDPCFSVQEIPVMVDIIGSVSETGNKRNIEIFPNPADELLNISADFNMESIILQNHFGQVVMVKKAFGKSIQINTSELSGGVYFVIIESGDRQSMHKVVIR